MTIWKALILSLCATCCSPLFAQADSTNLGTTYPIAEKNALTEIESRASGVDWSAELAKPQASWAAMQTSQLPPATKPSSKLVTPWYTLPNDIAVPGRGTVYPAGFKFNPLAHIRLPHRIVILRADQVQKMKPVIRQTDFVLISGDVLDATKTLGRQAYALTEKAKVRLFVERAPTIITQRGDQLHINEIFIGDKAK